MGKEKRMIGDYTVLCSVNVGEKEVILASNEQSTDGEKFLCGFVERNDLFELCKECVVSDDYSVRVNQYSVGHYEILGYGIPQY